MVQVFQIVVIFWQKIWRRRRSLVHRYKVTQKLL
ncbi:unnamed protein product [Haemonchus placei]|uniref:Uncharacterized protein n=1 Tax=Haemonchus placei TaxID=6290 RepID=A0A0N4XBN9_HAEPC|nr:unnamed protein product [Haemonchus placei]